MKLALKLLLPVVVVVLLGDGIYLLYDLNFWNLPKPSKSLFKFILGVFLSVAGLIVLGKWFMTMGWAQKLIYDDSNHPPIMKLGYPIPISILSGLFLGAGPHWWESPPVTDSWLYFSRMFTSLILVLPAIIAWYKYFTQKRS